jgi:hypothetical protein
VIPRIDPDRSQELEHAISPAPALLALRGRVVTMDRSNTVIQDGVVYIPENVIVVV